MTKSTKDDNFFERLEFIVDKYLDGNQSELAKMAGIPRQYVNKWFREYEEKGKQPNPGQRIIEDIVTGLMENTDVNPIWFITGKGPKTINEDLGSLAALFENHKNAVDSLKSTGKPPDEIVQYLLKNRKIVLEFLRSLE